MRGLVWPYIIYKFSGVDIVKPYNLLVKISEASYFSYQCITVYNIRSLLVICMINNSSLLLFCRILFSSSNL